MHCQAQHVIGRVKKTKALACLTLGSEKGLRWVHANVLTRLGPLYETRGPCVLLDQPLRTNDWVKHSRWCFQAIILCSEEGMWRAETGSQLSQEPDIKGSLARIHGMSALFKERAFKGS